VTPRQTSQKIADYLTPKVALWPKGSLAKGPPSAPVGGLPPGKTPASAMSREALEKSW